MTTGINEDTIALVQAKFDSLREKYESDLNLIVGLGSNRNDPLRRDQLFGDWGDVHGRDVRRAQINVFTDFLASLAARVSST